MNCMTHTISDFESKVRFTTSTVIELGNEWTTVSSYFLPVIGYAINVRVERGHVVEVRSGSWLRRRTKTSRRRGRFKLLQYGLGRLEMRVLESDTCKVVIS